MKKASKLFSLVMLCALMFLMTACGGGKKFTHGTISGSTYTSDFLGLKATFGSEWDLYSDSRTAAYNGLSDMSASSIETSFKNNGTIYDMVVAKPDGSSMNIVIQDTTKTGSLKESDYFTKGVDLLKTQLEATGAKATVRADTTTFLGKSTRCIKVQMTMNGVTVHMIQVPIFKGDYIASITVGSLNENDLPSFMATFKAV